MAANPLPSTFDADRRLVLCQKTVDTFGLLLNRTLVFMDTSKEDQEGRGVGIVGAGTIQANIEDPYYYTIIEQALAHTMFGTSRSAQEVWINLYSVEFCRICDESGVHFEPYYIINVLNTIIPILDNYRVRQLWGEVYVGSSEYMQALMRRELQLKAADAHASLSDFIAWQAADPSKVLPGKYSKCAPIIQEHLLLLHGQSFGQLLAVTRSLIRALVDYLVQDKPPDQQQDPATRAQAADKLMKALKSKSSINLAYTEQEEHEQNAVSPAQRDADTTAVSEGMEEPAPYGTDNTAMQKALDLIRQPNATGAYAGDNKLIIECPIVWEDIHAITPGLSAADLVVADRIRMQCLRALQKTAMSFDSAGISVDIQQLIQRRVSKQAVPVFNTVVPTRGFRAIVLVDRSGSMKGWKDEGKPKKRVWDTDSRLAQAYRAANILQTATAIPKVRLDVWGFTEYGTGIVQMNRYLNHCGEPEKDIRGSTPIHVALQSAVNELSSASDTNHIFLLTDGAPSWNNFDKTRASLEDLMTAVKNVVSVARKRRIVVSTMLIGPEPRNDKQDGITNQQASEMFGHGYARAEMSTDIPRILVPLVSGALLRWTRMR